LFYLGNLLVLQVIAEKLSLFKQKKTFDRTSADIHQKPNLPGEATTHHELSAHHDFQKIGLSFEEKKSLHRYTRDSSIINSALLGREKSPHILKKVDEHHQQIQKAIAKAPALEKPTSVYSGIDGGFSKQLKSGGIIHTPAYTSASVHAHVAGSFAKQADPAKNHTARYNTLHFKLPAGSKHGLYIGDNSVESNRDEREFLLKHNQKWKVTGHEVVKATNNMVHKDHPSRHNYHHVWTLEPHQD
jgi:hypothetical protein